MRDGLFAASSIALLVATGCQAGMATPPPVTPVPSLLLGLPVFLTAEPSILKLEDPVGRPLAMALEHDVRDVLEEAGFKLAPSAETAAGVVATIVIQRAGAIHADLFIHGAEACGVRLDISRGDALLATAEPEVPCVSTSTYYGVLTKDAAVGLVNTVSRAAPLIAVAETLRGGVFELYDADERPSTAVRAGSIAPPRSIATWSPGSADESLVDPWTASSPNVDRLPASGL